MNLTRGLRVWGRQRRDGAASLTR